MSNPHVDFTPSRPRTQSASKRALINMGQSLNLKINVPADLSKLARAGLPTASFALFVKKGFSRAELDWIIPARTFTHRQKNKGVLTIEESDKLLRAAKIQALAWEVLGDSTKANNWLHQKRALFNGISAMELIRTEHGAQLVEEALIQMEEGYF
jgi:putative toxin-antitoxin system antitoxin component (TIGR02293 family)